MNRYNFLRILALSAGFGLVAYWTVFDVPAVIHGIALGAVACGGVCGCWVLIGIAERRARMRRFMLNQPNASERRYMEREIAKARRRRAEKFALIFETHQPKAAPVEVVIQTPDAESSRPLHEHGGARPSPFAQGGAIREASVVIVTRALQAIRVEMEGVSPEERAIVGERVARLARELKGPDSVEVPW